MPQLTATDNSPAYPTGDAKGAPKDKKPLAVPLDRLIYLQALFPYASFQQLRDIISDTSSTDEAASLGYDALNPDYTGLPYLRQQWDLKNDDTAPYSERKGAFQGISETLSDRASELFRSGQLSNVSSVREYDMTGQLYPIDTSEWDAVYLHGPKSNSEYANEVLPLTSADLSASTAPKSPQLQQSSLRTERMPSLNVAELSLGASGLEIAAQGPLPAPIVRWAPRAMRVSTHQAREAQQEIFRIFDDAAFFSSPLVPFNLSVAEPSPDDASSSVASQHEPAPAPAARGTARSLESHEPVDDEANPDGLLRLLPSVQDAGLEDRGPDSVRSNRVMGPRSRASALVALEEQKTRGGSTTSERLLRRMQKLKPLDNTVFQQPDAAAAVDGGNTESSPLGAAREADPRSPPSRVMRTRPNGAGASSNDGSERRVGGMPRAGSAPEAKVQSMGIGAFLEHDIAQWDTTISMLTPYKGVFDYKNRCELVVQLYDRCPLLVKRLDLIAKRVLPVLAAEMTGKRLSEGLREEPIELPLFSCKLLSTGEIRLRDLSFDVDKCTAGFQDEGCRIRLKLKVKDFALEPVSFAYIDEATATKERRKNKQQAAQSTRHGSHGEMSSSESSNYVTGVTKGIMTVACSNVSLDIVGGAWLLSSGKMFLIVESAKVSIGSLKISSNVTKLNVLTTLAKPLIKATLKNQIRSSLEGSHSL